MSTQTVLFVPPTRTPAVDSKGYLSKPYQQYLFTLQYLLPLILVNTAAGSFTQNPPAPGLHANTGQSNQNQEIIYKKTSADGNSFTLAGTPMAPLPEGPIVLTAQYSKVRIKSDGTQWWVVG
jgi:hypothetical protein